jgi:adenylosuccinate lyase
MAALENIALWHERDISHSSVERVIIPDSAILIDYMLNRLKGIISGLHVYPENMLFNMDRSFGLYNSQKVLIALTQKGLSREAAYEMVQRNAMKSWADREQFKGMLLGDKDVTRIMSQEEIEVLFDVKNYLRNIDFLYKRIFG